MALKDLVSDLSNFKGRSQYDKLDDQIKNGVDFIPNTDAPGFTPKTDLESLFNKVKEGIIGPIGGNAPKYSNLLAGERTSQFSFPETKGATNIYINPEGFSGLQTTLNLPRELFRFANIGPENDIFKDSFSTLGLGSSNFTNRIDLFHRYENSDFTNTPSGLTIDNNFPNLSLGLGGSFRQAADPVNLAHPIVLRPIGSNWENANSDLQIPNIRFKAPQLVFDNKLEIEGLSLATQASRNIADNFRITRWSLTPQGVSFLEKQHSLQRLNPTLETKDFNDKSILGVAGGLDKTSLPIFHPERHIGGLASRYENVLDLTGLNPEPGIQLTGGSRLAYQAEAFSVPIPISTVDTGNNILNSIANFAINTYNAAVDLVKAPIMIGLSNPNKYAPFPSAAPISTKLGLVSFGIPTAQIAIDTFIALNKPGGTFNKNTAQKTDGDLIKRHSTLSYGMLVAETEMAYGKGLSSAGEYNRRSDRSYADYEADLMVKRYANKEISDNVGHQGILTEVPKIGPKGIGVVKGNLKSPNVDKVNALRFPLDYNQSPDNPELKDFIKFKFKDIVNNRFLIFRAILDGISDSITPEYGEEKYIGRPDKVYVYQGADRNVSFNFSIYPKTKQEFPILMNKLNHLIGLCYPSYTKENMMVTPLIELTLGDMFKNATGLLGGLTVTVEDNSTWELDEGLQFPHFIRAACEFKYIGNDKLSSTSIRHYNGLNYLPTAVDSDSGRSTTEISSRRNTPLTYDIEPVREPYLPDANNDALAGTSA